MLNHDFNDISKELQPGVDDKELCIFIVNLLEYCGKCVERGYMKPFVIRNRTLAEAREIISTQKDADRIVKSYEEFVDEFNSDNLFKESEHGRDTDINNI